MDGNYELLNIPKQCRLKNRIALNLIYKELELTTKEQKDFSRSVDKIYLIAEINSSNCNYLALVNEELRYETIQFIYVHLLQNNSIENVDMLLHRLFPNPVILIYDYDSKYSYSSAMKRINKVDNSKAVISDIYNTSFNVQPNFYENITSIFSNRNIKTIYELYKNIDDSIYYQMLYQITKKKIIQFSIRCITEITLFNFYFITQNHQKSF